ncbi:MAG: hypothetical protein OQL16_13800 [Gammaproteobacteria bacterium]|nr:hypothetical protein [Gammaproteobacteria bacterium]
MHIKDEAGEQPSRVRVECYAGHRADEEPRRFFIGEREIKISETIDRWLDPQHRYFKVRGDDGGIYILRHDVDSDTWEMTLFDSGSYEDSRLSST